MCIFLCRCLYSERILSNKLSLQTGDAQHNTKWTKTTPKRRTKTQTAMYLEKGKRDLTACSGWSRETFQPRVSAHQKAFSGENESSKSLEL